MQTGAWASRCSGHALCPPEDCWLTLNVDQPACMDPIKLCTMSSIWLNQVVPYCKCNSAEGRMISMRLPLSLLTAMRFWKQKYTHILLQREQGYNQTCPKESNFLVDQPALFAATLLFVSALHDRPCFSRKHSPLLCLCTLPCFDSLSNFQ